MNHKRVPGIKPGGVPPSVPRPYRSHNIPACDRCRKRKQRCIVEVPGQPCLLCHADDTSCVYTKETGRAKREKRPRRLLIESTTASSNTATPEVLQSETEHGQGHLRNSIDNVDENRGRAAMIVDPVTAEDIHIIEEYMNSKRLPKEVKDRSYNVVSNDPAKPILYLSVPSRRKGFRHSSELPGSSQREIMEQILGPLTAALIDVYFEHIHSWFPILDPTLPKFSPAMYCDLYATSLIYWHQSAELKKHPRPDVAYAWNIAVTALHEEFLSPSLYTLYASLLDLNGRPVTSITGNVLQSGRTVALAHSLGLNRDPSNWSISTDEKHARIRLWWGVLIHDRWSSFAHGVPATIAKGQYDVPQPDTAVLRFSSTIYQKKGTESFFALCSLTEILADILPLIYNLEAQRYKDSLRELRRVQIQLEDWDARLPAWLRRSTEEGSAPQSGACSLQLSFLAIKMLMSRISLRDIMKSQETNDQELRDYHQSELRKSATAIVSFVCSLKRCHLQEFWLPYGTYQIASAAIVLLRCTIDAAQPTAVEICKDSLQQLMTRLREAKETDNWDMGDICLAQCRDSVAAITAAQEILTRSAGQDQSITALEGMATSMMEEQDAGMRSFLQMQNGWGLGDDLQYPWVSLWDVFEQQGSSYQTLMPHEE